MAPMNCYSTERYSLSVKLLNKQGAYGCKKGTSPHGWIKEKTDWNLGWGIKTKSKDKWSIKHSEAAREERFNLAFKQLCIHIQFAVL